MDKSDIEYLITNIIFLSEDIVIMEWALDHCYSSQEIIGLAKEQLQLLYVNRDLSKQELMDLAE